MACEENGRHTNSTKRCSPGEGIIKLNVDVAQEVDRTGAGIGAIICDSNGELIAAMAKHTRPMHSVFVQEMIAVKEGVDFARQIGISELIIETDASNVLAELKQRSFLSEAGHIVEGIYILLEHLKSFKWSFCRREGNYVAHNLAKHALEGNHEQIWLEDYPPFLLSTLQNDVNLQ